MFEERKRELKFRYKKPSSKEENLEAIYEELSENEISNSNNRTLKTHVYEIVKRLREADWERKRELEKDDSDISWAMGFLAFIALILIISGFRPDRDFNWLQQNSFSIKIWGIALATLYIGVSIEKFSVFRSLWQFSFTKLVTSISISGLIVFSTGKAAGAINSVFGVDASAFPFTLTFTSSLVFFHYILPFLALVGFFAAIYALDAFGWVKSLRYKEMSYNLPPVHSFAFPILASVVLVVFWGWSKNDLGEKKLPSKIYKLAHLLDFNSKNECANIKSGVPIVFLGSSQTAVLVDVHSSNINNLKSFFEKDVEVPNTFYRLECGMPEYSRKQI